MAWHKVDVLYARFGRPSHFDYRDLTRPKWNKLPDYWHMVPKTMTQSGGHGGSHPFLTHEFVSALVEDREPVIDLYESLAMTVPGIVAHQSALKGGEQLKIPSFEQA